MPPYEFKNHRSPPVAESQYRPDAPRASLSEVLESTVNDENSLKVEINTFVWMHAPAEMTLGKADELACQIFEMFLAARKAVA